MIRLICVICAVLLAAAGASSEEKRIALLIGNEDYPPQVGRLSLPSQDVSLLSGALADVGFDVTVAEDLDEHGMEDALSSFEEAIVSETAAGREVVAFFYYSGHGASAVLQGTRQNFLLPARETITNASQLARKGMKLDDVVTGLSLTPAKAVFVVADACRNDLQPAFGRSADKGFAPAPTRPGMFIAHSTYPGQTAPDDGAFARTLANQIRKPGLYSERAFALTNREVAATRGLSQIPTVAGALTEDFCFNGCPGTSAVPVTSPSRQPPKGFAEFFVHSAAVLAPAAVRGWRVRLPASDPSHATIDESQFVFFERGAATLSDETRERLDTLIETTLRPALPSQEALLQHQRMRALHQNGLVSDAELDRSKITFFEVVSGCSLRDDDPDVCRDRGAAVLEYLTMQGILGAAFVAPVNHGKDRPLDPGRTNIDVYAVNQYVWVRPVKP